MTSVSTVLQTPFPSRACSELAEGKGDWFVSGDTPRVSPEGLGPSGLPLSTTRAWPHTKHQLREHQQIHPKLQVVDSGLVERAILSPGWCSENALDQARRW